MKKKLAALLSTAVLLCGCLGLSAMAAKPNVELMCLDATWGDNYVSAPTFFCRNNSGKVIKYLDWYVTAYNAVNDPIPAFASKEYTTIGPIEPFCLERNSYCDLETQVNADKSSPFYLNKETVYFVAINDELEPVYQDEHNNFFIKPNESDPSTFVYLSEDEIQNATFTQWCDFSDIDIGWRVDAHIIDRIQVDKVVITYMDGKTETIVNVGSKYRTMTLQNPPFYQQLAQYQAVYNYQDYLTYNPDLAALYGADQKKLFDHFVTSGMKEGRRGSSGFDLNTYKANNPELVAMFGDDNVKYYEHYIANGKAEGRIAA